MKIIKKREYIFDLLRIIATFCVIVIHVPGMFYEHYPSHINFMIGQFFEIFARVAVPIFLMLSGAFILRKNEDYKSFYKKAFLHLGVPFIIVCLIYFIIDLTLEKNFKEILLNYIIGEPRGHLWYMFMLIGIYLLIPLIKLVMKNSSRSLLNKLIIFLLIWGICSIWTIDFKVHWNGECLAYLGYFLIGYMIKESEIKRNGIKYLLIGILILLFDYYIYVYFSQYFTLEVANKLFLHRLSLFIAIASICIFIGFCNLSININLYNIAKKTYMIYLIHGVFLGVYKRLFIFYPDLLYLSDIILIFGGAVLIFIFSYLFSCIFYKIGGKIWES